MVDRRDIEDPALRAVFDRVAELIEKRMTDLARGGAMRVPESGVSTGEAYHREVGYINAMTDVLSVLGQLERQRRGARPGEIEGEQA